MPQRDQIIYPGTPEQGPGRWSIVHAGFKCRLGFHVVGEGVIARFATGGGVECLGCVQRYGSNTAGDTAGDTSREAA